MVINNKYSSMNNSKNKNKSNKNKKTLIKKNHVGSHLEYQLKKLILSSNYFSIKYININDIEIIFKLNLSGVVLKFTEPLEAKLPNEKWRLYPFKGNETLCKTLLVFKFLIYFYLTSI